MIRQTLCLPLACAAMLVSVPAARGDDAVPLDSRYIDPIHGFSLRPPTGTERRKYTSQALLASWLRRDAATGAVAWTLSVLRAVEAEPPADLAAYAKELVARLRKNDDFDVKSSEVVSVAGRKVVDIRGVSGGEGKPWKRQVHVQAEPACFLVVQISGPAGMRQTLDAVCQAVLETLSLFDPKAAAARSKEDLARGEKLLASLTDEKLAAAVGTEQWFLLRIGGAEGGWAYVRDKEVRLPAAGAKGYEVAMCWYVLQGQQQPPSIVRRRMVMTADRAYERWVEAMHEGSTAGQPAAGEEGSVQAGTITCAVSPSRTGEALRQRVEPKVHMPRALEFLLPRVVDLSAPAGYAFGNYDSGTNRYTLRTFTVVGPDRVTLGDRHVEAVRLTDQTSVNAEPATLWVDEKGRLLRMSRAEGFAMTRAEPSAVQRRYADAEAIVKDLEKLSVD